MSKTSDRLKEAMRIRDMKQVDLLARTGINKGAMSSYLAGRYEPKQKNLHALARALNVSEAWLMGLDVPMEPSAPAPAAAPQTTPDQEELMRYYDALNDEGQAKVRDYAADLVAGGRYGKDADIQSVVSGTSA